jgi:hypothetical protein
LFVSNILPLFFSAKHDSIAKSVVAISIELAIGCMIWVKNRLTNWGFRQSQRRMASQKKVFGSSMGA